MEYSVKLASLPHGVKIPERLRERMSFDGAKQQLTYHGFMTKCTYDELVGLADDVNFHRALEELFVLTSREMAPQPRSRGLAAMLLAAAAVAVLAAVVVWAMTHRPHAEPGEALSTVTASTAS